MRQVDSSHRWDYGAMQCTKCYCSTRDDMALAPCAFGQPSVSGPMILGRAGVPKVPDLIQTSMPIDDAPPKK